MTLAVGDIPSVACGFASCGLIRCGHRTAPRTILFARGVAPVVYRATAPVPPVPAVADRRRRRLRSLFR